MATANNRTELDNIRAEYRRIQRQFRKAAGVSIVVLGIGTVFYHFTERLSWLDSLYFCTITLTTIGYGDITPTTSAGKAFTIAYAIVGIGIIAYFVNVLFKNAIVRRQLKQTSKNK